MALKKISEFVVSNPKVKLDSENEYDFVEMSDIVPGRRYVYSHQIKMVRGGSKFQHGDILFARITPCLEHGKIAQYISSENKSAFGSTEFFVFRNIPGVSDINYLYYLLLTDDIRKPAEQSMVGASGRQRADIDAIKNIEIDLPIIECQRKIGKILSNYDNLAENNSRRVEIIESMAKLIYDEWFVKFKFPGHEKVKLAESGTDFGEIPEDWEVKSVKELLKRHPAGKKYTQDNVESEGRIPVVDQSEKEFLGFHNLEADHKANPEHPIMIFGDHTCKMKIMVKPFSVGPNTIPFISTKYSEAYIYFLIRNLVHTQEYKRHWNELIVKKVVVPKKEIVDEFAALVMPMLQQINVLQERKLNLAAARDLLLAKLISGELDVSELGIKVSEVEV